MLTKTPRNGKNGKRAPGIIELPKITTSTDTREILAHAAKRHDRKTICPHAGGPVCQGKIFQKVEEVITPDHKSAGMRFGNARHIVCPWHGYEYDLATGCHPGDTSVRLTPVKVAVRNGEIYISLPR